MPLIYLDNSTTTRPSDQTISRMLPFFTQMWGTPSAPHFKGQELYTSLNESFKQLYQFLGAKEADQFVFTSSGTEAINHVIHAVYRDVTLPTGRNQYLTSQLGEAPSIMATERLEPLGCVAKSIDVNTQGIITIDALAEALSPRTALLSLSWANGLSGVIQPLQEIADLCRQRGVLLHVDATHILGKLFYELEDLPIDFLTFNGDHLHAPKGTGGLLIRQGLKSSPFIVGGLEQAGQRAGSFNIAGLVALAAAANEALESRDYMCTEIARLRDKLENEIVQQLPQAQILFTDQERLPHCSAIAFKGIVNEALLFNLNRKGICASIGGGNFQQIGLMLSSCGLQADVANGAVAFSLSRYTTEEEIDEAIAKIVEVGRLLNKISTSLIQPIEIDL
jgi:cysteine desulfurase